MRRLLDTIYESTDLKAVAAEDLPLLASEVRELIIETVSELGGHLGSSLGAVEIAIALHYVLDTPEDKIIWDVGHQAYAHKILTGRKDSFKTLRQFGGISGFPKPTESPYDAFIAGHSSTSISAALGMAAARDLEGKDYKVVAVIGDGSLTAGLAFEGLNQAGHLKKNLIVILNDNEMSISQNVGALSQFLSRKLTGRFATNLKKDIERFIRSIPRIGSRLLDIARRAEDSIITLLTPGMLFEGLGFHYIGPIDGHDLPALVTSLKDVSTVEGPVLLHVLTKKGKGYLPAEADPAAFHGVGPFIRETGRPRKPSKPSYTNVFSSALLEIAEQDSRVIAITAAMPEGTGLSKFAQEYPDRFFDVGIAEQHALTFAAGLAKEGFVPVTAIYSTFLQRAYDEVFHDVCLQNLPVVIAMDRAGIVGQDGPTHHGLFDISFLRHIPNMVVAAPKDEAELRHLLYSAVQYGRPTALRYPRGACLGINDAGPMRLIPLGQAEVLKEGKDATIIAIGTMVQPAVQAAERLEKAGIRTGVVNARFAKPLDAECICKAAATTGAIITVEENALQGGFGSAVLELFEEKGVSIPVKRIGVPDEFIEHGSQEELRARLGLTVEGIEAAVVSLLKKDKVKLAFH
ncbi:MAG: 1-deoxy-D-xylulose-5-phosphate synthase [Deltaproteobacteria bacterium GWA2_55_10]|nr:MAG: 1-deoxy-D-xylulose-5-phosphate synthase [Deltaproteobacteria bacterium GWA2_55_10]